MLYRKPEIEVISDAELQAYMTAMASSCYKGHATSDSYCYQGHSDTGKSCNSGHYYG